MKIEHTILTTVLLQQGPYIRGYAIGKFNKFNKFKLV